MTAVGTLLDRCERDLADLETLAATVTTLPDEATMLATLLAFDRKRRGLDQRLAEVKRRAGIPVAAYTPVDE